MFKKNIIKKIFILFLMPIIFIYSQVSAKKDPLNKLFKKSFKNRFFDNSSNLDPLEKFDLEIKIRNEKEELETKNENFLEEINNTTDLNRKKFLKNKIRENQKRIKIYNKRLNASEMGKILLAGIVGAENWKMIANQDVESIKEALEKGIALRAAVSTGDAIGESFDDYIKRLIHGTLNITENIIKKIKRIFLNKNCNPIEVHEIDIWEKLITNDLREIELMVRQAEKYNSRSRQEIFRKFNDQNNDDIENAIENENLENNINLWKDFSSGFALTCLQIAEELEARKNYYKQKTEGFNTINCINRIINQLKNCSNWILSTKSLQEFSELPEAKVIIPTTRKSIENYFQTLLHQIKPLTSNNTKNKSSYRNNSKQRWDMNQNFDYPRRTYGGL